MRGLLIDASGLGFRDDLPEPEPGPGECRVEVLGAGVCATDLALRRGYMGFSGVPGHEFVGRALDGPLAGRRVVGEINAGCGVCERCLAGDSRHCAQRTVLGILGRSGAFAERLVLPAANLLAVPARVSTDAALFTEPLAAALEITAQLDVRPGTEALVAGDGRLGLLCAHALARAGARVTVAGRHAAHAALLPDAVRHVTGLLEVTSPPGDGRYDLAVEATGGPDALARLLRHVRPRGTIVLKTTSERPVSLDLAPFVVDEQTLLGSRCGRFGPALEALASGSIPVESMIAERYPLERGDEAMDRAATSGVLKVVVDVAPRR